MSWMFKCMRNYEGRNGNNVSVSYYEHLDFVLQQSHVVMQCAHFICLVSGLKKTIWKCECHGKWNKNHYPI